MEEKYTKILITMFHDEQKSSSGYLDADRRNIISGTKDGFLCDAFKHKFWFYNIRKFIFCMDPQAKSTPTRSI